MFNDLLTIPDPRPSKAHPEHRAARKAIEAKHPFDAKDLGLRAGILALLVGVACFPAIKAEHDKEEKEKEKGHKEKRGAEKRERRRSEGQDRRMGEATSGRRRSGEGWDRRGSSGWEDGYRGWEKRDFDRRGGSGKRR